MVEKQGQRRRKTAAPLLARIRNSDAMLIRNSGDTPYRIQGWRPCCGMSRAGLRNSWRSMEVGLIFPIPDFVFPITKKPLNGFSFFRRRLASPFNSQGSTMERQVHTPSSGPSFSKSPPRRLSCCSNSRVSSPHTQSSPLPAPCFSFPCLASVLSSRALIFQRTAQKNVVPTRAHCYTQAPGSCA